MRLACTTAVLAVLGLSLLAPHTTARADLSPPYITDIGVTTNGSGTATYYLCVQTSNPPLSGAVNVSGPSGELRAAVVAAGTCGPLNGVSGLRYSATFSNLAPGAYAFVNAGVTDVNNVPYTLAPSSAFASNGYGDTVASMCQVNFDPSVVLALRNCVPHGPPGDTGGVGGSLSNMTPPTPTATSTPPDTPTSTATSSATTTATPSPSPTPVTRLYANVGQIQRGHALVLTGVGYRPGESVAFYIDRISRQPRALGLASATGDVRVLVTVPVTTTVGTHALIGLGLRAFDAAWTAVNVTGG